MEQFNDKGYGQAFHGQGQPPSYGFSNSYQIPPAVAALGRVLDALQDPRMAAFAPGMGLIRAPGMAGQAARSMTPAIQGERGSFSPGWGRFPEGTGKFGEIPGPPPDLGGYAAREGSNHLSPVTNRLSNDPISWAKLLDRRYDRYNDMIQDGVREGMSPSQAESAVRSLNLAPPGLEETENLRFFRRSPANDN